MVQCNAGGVPALRGRENQRWRRVQSEGHTALAVLLANDLELAFSVTLDPVLDPGKPSLQFFEEGPGSCPVQHDDNSRMRKSGLWVQKM
jgi:hypothetical protein